MAIISGLKSLRWVVSLFEARLPGERKQKTAQMGDFSLKLTIWLCNLKDNLVKFLLAVGQKMQCYVSSLQT